jgi:hypothetical protein
MTSQGVPIAKRHQVKEQVVAALMRMSDRDTLASAVRELDNIISTLDIDGVSVAVTCLVQSINEPKAFARRECVLAFAK